MTEDLLRLWVCGELPMAERRAVSRWVVECADPQLPSLLAGMLQERRDETADRSLADKPGVWRTLVDGWRRLLDVGRAELSSGGGELVLASAEGTRVAELSLLESGGEVEAVFRPAATDDVAAMFVTDDGGVALRLVGPVSGEVLRARVAAGSRTTVWGVYGPSLALTADPAGDLARLLDAPGVVAVAVRLRPTH